MSKEQVRIKLDHGTARVSKDVKPETIAALNNLVSLAYSQVKASKSNLKEEIR